MDRAVTLGTVHSGLANPSLFNPPVPAAPAVNIFRDLVLKDLPDLPIKKCQNFSMNKKGLKSLCGRKDLIVRPADKGGGIIVMNKSDYISEMPRILSDQDTYAELPSNPTNGYKRDLTTLVKKGFDRQILNKKEKAYLIPTAPRIPIIYHLPKIHKDPCTHQGDL